MKKKYLIRFASVVAILAVGVLGMTYLGSTEKHSNKKDPQPNVRLVETIDLTFGDHLLEVEGNGIIQSQNSLNYISEATGKVLFAKNNLKDGTQAKKGEILVKIDSREVNNNLISLRSDFLNTVAGILPELKVEESNIYKKWYSYFEKIKINEPLPDLPEVETNQEQIKLSSRNLFKKYYDVKNQEITLSKYEITSPFDGFISGVGVIENSFVSKGQHLFTVVDAANVEIAIPLLVEDFKMIDFSKSPKVKIFTEKFPNEIMYGRIIRKETKIDRNSQSINTYVTFTNTNLKPSFLPGNYVSVAIEGEQLKNVAVVPRYLIDDDNEIYTLENGKLNKRKVELVAFQSDKAIIRGKELKENSTLVSTVLQKPLIGMEIKSIKDQQDDLNKEVAESSAKNSDSSSLNL